MQIRKMKALGPIGAIGKGKISDFHALRNFYAQKIVTFVVQCCFFCFVSLLLLVSVFARVIYFGKKKK